MTTTEAILLIGGGVLAGAANTLAGGGSSVTLPILLGSGMTASIANGTNHVAHLFGAASRLTVFARSTEWNWRTNLLVAAPTCLGALVGTWLATVILADRLHPIIVGAVVVAAMLLVLNPKRFLRERDGSQPHVGPWQNVLLALVGFWAGFVVIGAGTFQMQVLVLSVGFALTEALAVNALVSFLTMTASVWLFIADGAVDWVAALCLAAGTIVGSWLTAHLAVRGKAKVWLFWLVVVVVWSEMIYLVAQSWMQISERMGTG